MSEITVGGTVGTTDEIRNANCYANAQAEIAKALHRIADALFQGNGLQMATAQEAMANLHALTGNLVK